VCHICVCILQETDRMNADIEEQIGADNHLMLLRDEETGSLLLTADCCEDTPSLPRMKRKTSMTWARKKANVSSNATIATAKKRNVSTDRPLRWKKKVAASINRPPRARRKKAVKLDRTADSEGKRYSCAECGRSYMQASSLRTHMRYHSGERPFSCTYCSKSFVQSGHLTSHLRLHTGERRHACDICDKRFGAAGDLKVTVLLSEINDYLKCWQQVFHFLRVVFALKFWWWQISHEDKQ